MPNLEDAWGEPIYKSAARTKLPSNYKSWLRTVMGGFGKKNKTVDGHKTSTAESRRKPGWTFTVSDAARDRNITRDVRRLLTKYMERVKRGQPGMTFDIRHEDRRKDTVFTVEFTFAQL